MPNRSTPALRAGACLLALTATWAVPSVATAQTGATEIPSTASRVKPPLSPLPKAPSRRLANAAAADIKTLDEVLDRIRGLRGSAVPAGLKELLGVDPSLLPAIKHRLDREAENSDRARMKRLLLDVRADARKQLKAQMRKAGITGRVETPDYLEMLLTYRKADSKIFASLANTLALSRLCQSLESVEALRVLMHVYVRFDFLRIDTQLRLQELGEKALPALIETTRHPAPKVANWAKRQLDFLGRAIPSEAVQVKDPQILADILRAYGRLRDPDAARLVASFANSERAQVREAARQSITLFGEVANWQLRDTYEKMVGARPPRDWSWDRTAKELFREFDLIRLAELYRYFDQGLKALEAGEPDEMNASFAKVLTRDPTFSPNEQITKALLNYGRSKLEQLDGLETETLTAATSALERVARLSQSEKERAQAESLLLVTSVRSQLGSSSVAEELLLRRALKLDPENALATDLVDEITRKPVSEAGAFIRFLWPSLLLVISLVCAGLVLWRRPKAEPREV